MKTKQVFTLIAALLISAGALAQDTAPESDLIAVLRGDGGWEEKYRACTALRQVGTEASVDALAALLPDEKLGHMARYALEPMPGDKAGAALRAGLETTSGSQRIGVLQSLGVRRDQAAVPAIIGLLNDSDAATVNAAAAALGRIGSPEAANALEKALDSGKGDRRRLEEALLAAGTALLKDDVNALAYVIFKRLKENSGFESVRLGAYRGMVNANPITGTDAIIEGLQQDDDPVLRDFAGQLVAETRDATSTRRIANAIGSLSEAGQIALVRGLGDRGDPAAHDVVLGAMQDGGTPELRLTAMAALAKIGDAHDVEHFVDPLLSGDEAVAKAAEENLATLRGDGVDAAIAERCADAAGADRIALMNVLASRLAPQAVALAAETVAGDDASIRVAALEILARLAVADHVSLIIDTMDREGPEDQRATAAYALRMLCAREGAAIVPAVIANGREASPGAIAAGLPALSAAGGPEALQAVLEAYSADEAEIRESALSVLADWPTLDAAPHLLEIAKSADEGQAITALRGYIRLARTEGDGGKRTQMLKTAMDHATRPQEKSQIFSVWGTIHSPGTLKAIEPYLADTEVQKEAAVAMIGVAEAIAKRNDDAKAAAVAALQKVIEAVESESIRNRAQKVLDGLG